MGDIKKFLEEQLENEEFKKEYESSRVEFDIVRAIIRARIEQNITQKELSVKSGIRQSNISRIETGSVSPTIATLEALAEGLGKRLKIEFVDKWNSTCQNIVYISDINEKYSDDISAKFIITLGDEFQGLLCNGINTMNIMLEHQDSQMQVAQRLDIKQPTSFYGEILWI